MPTDSPTLTPSSPPTSAPKNPKSRKKSWNTAPLPHSGMPGGIPYIVSNEAAERFSYYGMKGILVVFMTQYLMNPAGQLSPMSDAEATSYYHLFSSAVYFFPLVGALLSDGVLGKYRTILWLSILYCLGHLALALDETRTGLLVGLALIAIGSGGIKPCVSAHVGDQFGKSNKHLMERVFMWFYFAINLGAFASTLLTPWLLENHGPGLAFGVPGILMLTATVAFWMGRYRFIHIPAGGMGFLREVFSPEGLKSVGKLMIIYVFVAVFWALYDQTGSAWVLQARNMDRNLFGLDLLPSQIQAANPVLILLFIPLFAKVIYPAANRVWTLTPLRKIGVGFGLAVVSFLIPAFIESRIAQGAAPSIAWQLLAYVVLTAGEVMVSITCLEFSYTQASNKMKSFVMAVFFMSVSIGNLFTSGVNHFIQNPDGTTKFTGSEYYLFFAAVMLAATLLYIPVALWYKEKTYLQEEAA